MRMEGGSGQSSRDQRSPSSQVSPKHVTQNSNLKFNKAFSYQFFIVLQGFCDPMHVCVVGKFIYFAKYIFSESCDHRTGRT